MTVEAYPLNWPSGRPRTPTRNRMPSRFAPGNRAQEVGNVREEISRLGGRNIIVSTNARLRRDGLPYASDRAPDDQGVAVYFDYKGGQKCFACDRWITVEENLRAIFKSIEAIRGLDRWGSKDFVDAAFTGFAALPAPGSSTVRTHWEILGIEPGSPESVIRMAYRKAAMGLHKSGADSEAMSELNVARDEALRSIS